MVKETWDFVKDHRRMDNSDPDTDTEMTFDNPTNGNGRGQGHDSDDDQVPNQVESKGKGRPKKKSGKKGKGGSKKGVKSSPKKDAAPAKSKAKKTTAKKLLTGRVAERKSSRQPIPVQKAEAEVPEDYEVSKILKVRTTSNGKRDFYVSWKNYPISQSTWEPEAHLNCKDLVTEFLAKQKSAKGKSSSGKKRHNSAGSSSGGKRAKVDDDDDEEEYEVEKILSVRFSDKGKKEFQVKWKNYSAPTWEPEENLECADLLKEFAAKVADIKPKRGSGSGSATASKSRGRGRPSGPKSKSKSPAKSMSDQSEDDGEDEEYEVSKILDVRTKSGKREFYVQWKGYDLGESTWEPEDNLECKELLKEFMAKKNPPKTGGEGANKGKKRPAGPSSGSGRPKKAKTTKKKVKIQMVKPKKATPPKEDEEGEDAERKEEESGEDDGIEIEQEDYEVEKILAVRYKKNKKEFKIKWKGWDLSESTWEPEDNLECKDLLEEFMENSPANTTEEEGNES